MVEDEPCVGGGGFGADEGPCVGELAGCGSQPVADLVGAAVFAVLVDDPGVRCEGGQCGRGVVPVMGFLIPDDDFGKFEVVLARSGGVVHGAPFGMLAESGGCLDGADGAAVDDVLGAGDRRRAVADEECHEFGDLCGFGGPAQGNASERRHELLKGGVA